MTHNSIFTFFGTLFPKYYDSVDVWFPNGKGSIRIRLKKLSEEFIFTYVNDKEWSFETIAYYLNRLNEMKK